MRAFKLRFGLPVLIVIFALVLAVLPASASGPQQDDDLVERGRYLTTITGCIGCHTPVDPETFQPIAGMEFAGGNPFDLGPLGVVISKNITPDEETGIGSWTDEEIKTAISTGVSPDGLHLFPIMPYTYFNNMAEEDLDAIVAYLRTVEPKENVIPRQQILPPEQLPQLPRRTDIVAPDPSDTEARGRYLMSAVLACSDCHTPIDPETLAPVMDQYLAGGQPYEGPWGTIYGGNITPHEETGIASWSDEEIKRVIRTGVRPDGRVAVLMPWPEYAAFTDEDLDAVVWYLRNEVPAVENEVPAAALEEAFVRYVEIEEEEPQPSFPIIPVVGGVAFVLIGGAAALVLSRRRAPGA